MIAARPAAVSGEAPSRQSPLQETDETLIRRFVSTGDKAAFTALVGRHVVGMRRLLFGLFRGHREDMEDAEQEILLALYKSLPSFAFQSSFKTYLYRFARNRGIDMLRKRGREREVLRRWRRQQGPEDEMHPEELVLGRARVGEAMAVLFQLGERERTMVLMKEVEGLSLKEIAESMGLRLGTVKSRMHRTRARIEKILAARQEEAGKQR